jgi:hypothetical protein
VSPGAVRGGRAAGKFVKFFGVERDAGAVGCRVALIELVVRRGRKYGEIPLNADRNRCACPGEAKPFIARSHCPVGW